MVYASVDDQKLTLELRGLSKWWALKSRLEIPLDHIHGVHADPTIARKWWKDLHRSDHLPNVVIAGTFYQDGKRVFWDVKDPEKTIVIDVGGERYEQLIVQVTDPFAVADLINRAIYKFTA
jgi:hypothetical protein